MTRLTTLEETVLTAEDAVRLAERLASIPGFARGANRPATLAGAAWILIETGCSLRLASELLCMYRPPRWKGVEDLRLYILRAKSPTQMAVPHWRGFVIPDDIQSSDIDQFLDAIERIAEVAIATMTHAEREKLLRPSGSELLNSQGDVHRRLITFWLDQHERKHRDNPEPLPPGVLGKKLG